MRVSLTIAFSAMSLLTVTSSAEQWRVYFGSYTGKSSKGIYMARLDGKTGVLSDLEVAAEAKNPSFLAMHPNQQWLYAVSEMPGSGGKPGGAVTAFAVEKDTEQLRPLGTESSGGVGPCHVGLDSKGRCVLVANYGSGSVSALKIAHDGTLLKGSTIQHEGSSVHPKRQTGPHAHQAVIAPGNRIALVCDLGLDKVLLYALDPAEGLLKPHLPSFAAIGQGAGPRHLAFRSDGKFFYVINELNSTITAFAWSGKCETREIQTISTLPDGFNGENYCAEVVAHPNGRFVYGSNRGHDSVAVFSCDRKTGMLKALAHTSSGGKFPRYIGLDPKGKWLLSLNQNSGDVVVLKVDSRSGKLSGPVSSIQLDSPVCAVFARM